ncbi:hypothetical protein D3C80_2009140 [compost metagenome]
MREKDFQAWAGRLVSVLQQFDGDGRETTLLAVVTCNIDRDVQCHRAAVLRLTQFNVQKVEAFPLKIERDLLFILDGD